MKFLCGLARALKYGLVGMMVLLFINTACYVMGGYGDRFVAWAGLKVHNDKIDRWVSDGVRPFVVRHHPSMAAEDDYLRTEMAALAELPVEEQAAQRVLLTQNSWQYLRSDKRTAWLLATLSVAGFALGLAAWVVAALVRLAAAPKRPAEPAPAPGEPPMASVAPPAETNAFALPAVWPLALALIGGFYHGYALGLVAMMMTGWVRRRRWLNWITGLIAVCVVLGWAFGMELWWGPGWSKEYPWAHWLYQFDTVGANAP